MELFPFYQKITLLLIYFPNDQWADTRLQMEIYSQKMQINVVKKRCYYRFFVDIIKMYIILSYANIWIKANTMQYQVLNINIYFNICNRCWDSRKIVVILGALKHVQCHKFTARNLNRFLAIQTSHRPIFLGIRVSSISDDGATVATVTGIKWINQNPFKSLILGHPGHGRRTGHRHPGDQKDQRIKAGRRLAMLVVQQEGRLFIKKLPDT